MKNLAGFALAVVMAVTLVAPSRAATTATKIDDTTVQVTGDEGGTYTLDLDSVLLHPLYVADPGDLPIDTHIDREFSKEDDLGKTVSMSGTSFTDEYTFTVEAPATGTAVTIWFNTTSNDLGTVDAELSVWDETLNGGLGDWAWVADASSDLSQFTLALAFLDPSDSYLLTIASTITGIGANYDVEIALSAIPVPPALVLFGTAILGLIGFSGFRRREDQATA